MNGAAMQPALGRRKVSELRRGAPWHSASGPVRLLKHLGRLPDLIPYTYVARPTNPFGGQIFNDRVRVTLQTDGDSDFYCFSMSYANAEPGRDVEGYAGGLGGSPNRLWATVDISEDRGGNHLSNLPVSLPAMFGRGERPAYLPVPWIVRGGTTIEIAAVNGSTLSGTPGKNFFCFHGFKRMLSSPELPIDWLIEPRLISTLREYRAGGQLGHVEPFWYSFFYGHRDESMADPAFTALQTETPTITASDADFAGVYLSAHFYDQTGTWAGKSKWDGAEANSLNHLVQFVLDEGAIAFQDRPVALRNISGTGRSPFRLPKPWIVRAGQTLSAIVTPSERTDISPFVWRGYITLAGVRITP